MKKVLGLALLLSLSVPLIGTPTGSTEARFDGDAFATALIVPIIAGSIVAAGGQAVFTDTAPYEAGRSALFHICAGPGHTVLQYIGGGSLLTAASTGFAFRNTLSDKQELALISLGAFGAGILAQYINF
jgi:hypothetical protein